MDAGSATLLERAAELAQLTEAVAAAAAGQPRVLLIEGPAGIGKTALLRSARELAGTAGFRVLTARGGELEQELGLGIARQLFEPLLIGAGQAERAALLAPPAAALAGLFGLEAAEPDFAAGEFGSQHALYWLTARLAEHSPLLIAVDDLHWSDGTSLRWLGYLVRRLEDLPILLALARRIDEPGANADLLAAVAAESLARPVRPGPLSVGAVRALARDRFAAGPQDRFVRACHDAAGGNPLFTLQLMDAARAAGLQPVDLDADAVADLAPERVSQLVLDRLRRLPPDAIMVAEQAALLGIQAEVRHVRALSALTERQVLQAGDELAAAGLLRAGQPLEFIHPVVRSSVYESVPAGRRAGYHGRAARLLGAEGASPARVAMHLLNAPPAGDAWAVGILRAAASAEIRPETRATCLRRAIAEPVPASIRAEVLVELGQAESLTYDPRALQHLAEALRLSEDPCARATAAGQLAYCLLTEARAGHGAKVDVAVYAHSRGWLRIAQGRATEAAEDFQQAGRLMREAGHDFPGFWPWRVGAATAQLALGRRTSAAVLAREQLEIVRPFGAAGPTGIALRTLGLAERGTAALGLLAAAAEELARSPALLERAKAYLEFGAALRRAGQRADSREPLRKALDLADRCGAVPVAERAREELIAAGGRPRRTRIGGVGALTACELRVARRAACGRTNRQIAQELFVTMKAVEKHLASAYRKLGIQGRGELADALGAAITS